MLFSPGNKEEISSSARSEVAEQLSRKNRYKICVNITVACKEIRFGFLTPENCLKISGKVISQTLKSCDIWKLNLPISAKFTLLFPMWWFLLHSYSKGRHWDVRGVWNRNVESKDMWRRQYPDMAVQKGIPVFVREAWHVVVFRRNQKKCGWLTAFSIDSAWRAQEQKISVFTWNQSRHLHYLLSQMSKWGYLKRRVLAVVLN